MLDCKIKTIKKDMVLQFGDRNDGAIELVGIVDNGYIELGYFYGKDKPKNLIVVSQQVGCPAKCTFCELGDKKFVRNLSSDEMYEQVVLLLQQASQYGIDTKNTGHKVNFSKSGEPMLNPNFPEALEKISGFGFSYKIASIFPAGERTLEIFKRSAEFASNYQSNVQVQISLISTSEYCRNQAAGIKLASFSEIREAAEYWKQKNPNSRKINLSLILTAQYPINVNDVCSVFPPSLFRFRFRNYVPTSHGGHEGLEEITQKKFEDILNSFKDNGYDVGFWATPTLMEKRFGLASNVTLNRYISMITGKI